MGLKRRANCLGLATGLFCSDGHDLAGTAAMVILLAAFDECCTLIWLMQGADEVRLDTNEWAWARMWSCILDTGSFGLGDWSGCMAGSRMLLVACVGRGQEVVRWQLCCDF